MASLSGSSSDCAEKGLVRKAMQPEATAASRATGFWFPVINITGAETPSSLRRCLSSMPDPSGRLMSRMMQPALSGWASHSKAFADENRTGSYACSRKSRWTDFSMPKSSSTTKTMLLSVEAMSCPPIMLEALEEPWSKQLDTNQACWFHFTRLGYSVCLVADAMPTRAAADTTSARVLTCIFSMTLWR